MYLERGHLVEFIKSLGASQRTTVDVFGQSMLIIGRQKLPVNQQLSKGIVQSCLLKLEYCYFRL